MNIKENILALEKWESRRGQPIQGVILHSMAGYYQGTLDWFNKAGVIASAHYLISKMGEISKCVQEEFASWHSGEVTVPFAAAPKIIREKWGINPNLFTIGIEMEDENNKDWSYPQKQYFACVELVADIHKRYGLEVSEDTVLMHKQVNPKHRSDPIGRWDHNQFIQDVEQSVLGNSLEGIAAPLYRYKSQVKIADWAGGLNIRSGASTKFDVIKRRDWLGRIRDKVLKSGEIIDVVGFVKGERIKYDTAHGTINTQFWWVTPKEEYLWSGGTAWQNGKLVQLTLKEFPKGINLQKEG